MNETTLQRMVKTGGGRSEGPGRALLIQRVLEGHKCSHCGSRRYFLVFRMVGGQQSGLLAARCSGCRALRELVPEELIPQDGRGSLVDGAVTNHENG